MRKLYSIFFISPIALLPYSIVFHFHASFFSLRLISLTFSAFVVSIFVDRFIYLTLLKKKKWRQYRMNALSARRDAQKAQLPNRKKKWFEIQSGHSMSGSRQRMPFAMEMFCVVLSGYFFSMMLWGYILKSIEPSSYIASVGGKIYQALAQSRSAYGTELKDDLFENVLYFFIALMIPIYKLHRKFRLMK